MEKTLNIKDEHADILLSLVEIDKQIEELQQKRSAVTKTALSVLPSDINGKRVILDNKYYTVNIKNGAKYKVINKDEFVNELLDMNKKYLVRNVLEPDVYRILAEVDTDNLDYYLVRKYIKRTVEKNISVK